MLCLTAVLLAVWSVLVTIGGGGLGGGGGVGILLVQAQTAGSTTTSTTSTRRLSSRIVNTTAGQLRGVLLSPQARDMEVVEAFLGVPYAAPPVGKLRYRFPTPAPRWRGVRVASTLAPACPQRLPDLRNRTAALERMPPGRLAQLERLLPLLREANQSEDCLALNIYVPGSGARGEEAPYAVVVWLHGESFEFGAGSLYDGSVLASVGRLVVVTVNYRLGVLGFLRTGRGLEGAGLLGARDVGAALRWVKANAAGLGGDPQRVTLIGHHTGAALANLALLDPTVKGSIHRAVLLSGSALSPWAVQLDSERVATVVARQVGCPPPPPSGAAISNNILECLEQVPFERLMEVLLPEPAFLPRVGPPPPKLLLAGVDPETAMREKTNGAWVTVPLLLGFTSSEVVSELGAHELQWGVEEERRAQLVRTFVRNAFAWHVTEIAAAVLNEYTDWARAVQHPISLRDNTLEALGDGLTVAPLLRVARLHARRGAPTFLYHFAYQAKDADYPQRIGSARGDDVAYLLGAPLVSGGRLRDLFPHNYTRQDQAVSSTLLACLANFAKSGDPNLPHRPLLPEEILGTGNDKDRDTLKTKGVPVWQPYDINGQAYLSFGLKLRTKTHYHAHRMSTWLHLIPQLHRPDKDEVMPRHHDFPGNLSIPLYAGEVRSGPYLPLPDSNQNSREEEEEEEDIEDVEPEVTVECTVLENGSSSSSSSSSMHVDVEGEDLPSELLHRETIRGSGIYIFSSWMPKSWPVALALCLGAGCLLLLLNICVFAAILYHRERRADSRRKRTAVELEKGSPPGTSTSGNSSSGVKKEEIIMSVLPSSAPHATLKRPPSQGRFCTPAAVPTLPPTVSTVLPPVKKRVQIQEICV